MCVNIHRQAYIYKQICTSMHIYTSLHMYIPPYKSNKHIYGSGSAQTHTHTMYVRYPLHIDENASPNTHKPLCLYLQTHRHAHLYGALCLYTGMYLCAHMGSQLYWSTLFLSRAPLCIDTQKRKLLDTHLCAHSPLFTYTCISACM